MTVRPSAMDPAVKSAHPAISTTARWTKSQDGSSLTAGEICEIKVKVTAKKSSSGTTNPRRI